MKYACLFLLCFTVTLGYSQGPPLPTVDIGNSELEDFDGNEVFFPIGPQSSGCPSWNSGSLPNWTRSHGSPNIFDLNGPNSGGAVFMFAISPSEGEGMFGNYVFTPNTHYVVAVGLRSWKNDDDQGRVLVMATSGLSQGGNPTSECWGQLTVPSSLQTIGEFDGPTQLTPFELEFDFVPVNNSSFNQLWIMPKADVLLVNNVHFVVDYVRIRRCRANGTLTFSSWQLPTFATRGSINVGSSFSATGSMVTNNFSASTLLLAVRTEIRHNFTSNISQGRFFEVRAISTCELPDPAAKTNPGSTPAVLEGRLAQRDRIAYESKTYPNPNNGTFTLEFNKAGDYNLRVINAFGVVVYSEKLSNTQRQVVQLDERLPSGNYTLQIEGEGIRYNERLSIIR